MTLTLHGSLLSPFTRKVALVLREKRLPYEFNDLNPYFDTETIAALNPLKRIPILEHEGLTLADSSAICGYAEAQFANSRSLMPKEAQAIGQALWIEEYSDTALFEVISDGVFRPIFINQMLGKAPDFEKVQYAVQNRLPEPLTYLDKQLEGVDWFAGNELGIADLAVYSQLVNLQHAEQLPSQQDYPNLMALFERVQKRAASDELHQLEIAFLQASLARVSKG